MKFFSLTYRANHSTETGLLVIFDSILEQLDSSNAVFLALLDLSAAFDTVDHGRLLRRLHDSVRVSGTALKWFESYLSDRTVRVCVHGEYSNENSVTCSVPQGSILGPKQYSIYTNPLGSLIRVMLLMFHMYADDTQLWKAFNPRNASSQLAASTCIRDGISKIADWMFENKLKLNREKTEFMVIVSSRNQHYITENKLSLEYDTINASNTVRNLGVTMDRTLSLMNHINNIRKTAFYYLRWIRKVRPVLTEYIAKCIVHALVISKIDYCNSLLVNLPASTINKLQSLMNAAARVVTLTPQDEHISPVLHKLHWLPVQQRIHFKILCITYKAIHGSAPNYLCNLITIYRPTRTLRSSSAALQLVIPRSKLRFGDRRFSVAAPRLWNSLPDEIRNSPSLHLFKKRLKTFLFSKKLCA